MILLFYLHTARTACAMEVGACVKARVGDAWRPGSVVSVDERGTLVVRLAMEDGTVVDEEVDAANCCLDNPPDPASQAASAGSADEVDPGADGGSSPSHSLNTQSPI
jgi:hypothetical protein